MGRLGYFAKDAFLLLSESKHQEQQLKLKRRWLMGLPSKPYERWSKDPKFLQKYGSLPESLLREDDVYYETIKTRVEESFGASNSEKEYNFSQDDVQLLDTCNLTRMLISCIDSLTNKGLYCIAMIFTGGSVMFEKTRSQMKRVIREFLSNYCRNQNLHCQEKNFEMLSELLNNPKIFRENYLSFFTPKLQSKHVIKVLDALEDLPTEALLVMHKKVRGVQVCRPKLLHTTINQSRGDLIDRLRKNIKKMLSKLSKGDELQEPLVKAMAVAGLAQKLKPGYQSSSEMEFYQFSPEIKSLQNEIVKAIWLIKMKARKSELKTLQRLLDPNADISNIRLRMAITKILIWYLFQTTDMNTIPKSLLEALAAVNRPFRRTPYRCFTIEEIEQDVECVLSISAQTKQIVLDFLPEHEFDLDFADAYMEELEESDNDDYYYDDDNPKADNDCWQHRSSRFPFVESDYKPEGIGESMPVDSRPPASATWENGSSAHLTPNNKVNGNSVGKIEPEDFTIADSKLHCIASSLQFLESRFLHGRVNMDPNQGQVENMGKVCSPRSVDLFSPNLSEDKKKIPDKESTFRNQYLAIQEVCDETSMVAYDLIGLMLEKFAQEDEIDLDGNDSSYLRGNSSNQEYAQGEKHTSFDEDMCYSVIVPVVEDRMPSFPKSGIEKLKKLIDS